MLLLLKVTTAALFEEYWRRYRVGRVDQQSRVCLVDLEDRVVQVNRFLRRRRWQE